MPVIVDLSYTRAPKWAKLMPGDVHDKHSTYWSLLKLLFPEGRVETLADADENVVRPAPRSRAVLAPDEQLACFDYLYYTCAHEVRAPSYTSCNPITNTHDSYRYFAVASRV